MSLSSTLPLKTIGCSALRCTCTFGAPASEEGEKLSPENVIFESWSGVSGGLAVTFMRSEEHTSELQSHHDLVCRLLLEKKKKKTTQESQKTQTANSHTTITSKTIPAATKLLKLVIHTSQHYLST